MTTRNSEAKSTHSCILNSGCPLLWGSCSICWRSCCCRSCYSPTPIEVASVSPALQQHLPSCSWLPLLSQRPICLHTASVIDMIEITSAPPLTAALIMAAMSYTCAFCCCYCHNVTGIWLGFWHSYLKPLLLCWLEVASVAGLMWAKDSSKAMFLYHWPSPHAKGEDEYTLQ